MGNRDERISRPKQVIHATTRGTFVGWRPRFAGVLAGKNSYFCSNVKIIRAQWMDGKGANGNSRETSWPRIPDDCPIGSAIACPPNVVRPITAECCKHDLMISGINDKTSTI